MATEGRPPEDLQEAVAATLRRLRGEVARQTAFPPSASSRSSRCPEAAPEPTGRAAIADGRSSLRRAPLDVGAGAPAGA
jgi:hypothetical protein